MERYLRDSDIDYDELNDFKAKNEDVFATLRTARTMAVDHIKAILARCKQHRLTFSDADDGEDELSGTIDTPTGQEEVMVSQVEMTDDGTLLLAGETSTKYYPWEIGIEVEDLLNAMVAELERELK